MQLTNVPSTLLLFGHIINSRKYPSNFLHEIHWFDQHLRLYYITIHEL